MIKITNGTDERVCTKGLFDSLYSYMGYKPVDNKNESKPKVEEPKVVEEPVKVEEVKEEVKEVPSFKKERSNYKK